MDSTAIVIALLVVLAIVAFVLLRKKAPSLPPEEAPAPPLAPKPAAPTAPRTAGEAVPARPAPAPEARPAPPSPPAPAAPPVAAPAAPPVAPPSVAAPPPAAEPVEPTTRPESQLPAPPPHRRDVAGLRKGLAKSRGEGGLFGRLAQLFTGKKEIDPAIADRIEEVLLTSDVGVKATQEILDRIREGMRKNELRDEASVWAALRGEAVRILGIGGGRIATGHAPTIVFMVGVNGVGKTTTIGKLATKLRAEGKTVLLAAGDTFRAAAVQQLEVWGQRVGCEVVRGREGSDPASVVFEAVQKAQAEGIDVVLADSAGRLQTKAPLMDELKKIARTMHKALPGAPHETLLVLDATNGQNAISQAALFKEAIPLSGIVLTKLDGTAKGGVVLGICDELAIPVRYVGLGERAEDLREFDAEEFVEALFGGAGESAAA
jgi:fused signal recognition particle receptor